MTRSSVQNQRQRDEAARILRDMRNTRRKLRAISAQNEAAWVSIDESLIEIDRRVHPEVAEALAEIVKASGR